MKKILFIKRPISKIFLLKHGFKKTSASEMVQIYSRKIENGKDINGFLIERYIRIYLNIVNTNDTFLTIVEELENGDQIEYSGYSALELIENEKIKRKIKELL